MSDQNSAAPILAPQYAQRHHLDSLAEKLADTEDHALERAGLWRLTKTHPGEADTWDPDSPAIQRILRHVGVTWKDRLSLGRRPKHDPVLGAILRLKQYVLERDLGYQAAWSAYERASRDYYNSRTPPSPTSVTDQPTAQLRERAVEIAVSLECGKVPEFLHDVLPAIYRIE